MLKKISRCAILFVGIVIIISCEKEIFVVNEEGDIPTYTSLDVSSYPDGAQVYINGKNSGYATPCKIPWVETGTIAVTFKLSLYYDGNITLYKSDTISAACYYNFYEDDRNYGTLYCYSTPQGASIYINGNSTGQKTPSYISNIRPGKYWVKYTYPEYRSDSAYVSVHAQSGSSDYTVAKKTLTDTSKYVSYIIETGSNAGNDVLVDNTNRVWYSSLFNGAYIFENKKFINYTTANSILPSDAVNYIFCDSDGNKWISTFSGLVKLSATGSGEVFTTVNSPLPVNKINTICEDADKNIWIGTDEGLAKYKDGAWTIYTSENSKLPSDKITSIAFSNDNELWIACYGYGIAKYCNDNWEYYTPDNSSISSDINEIYCGQTNIYAASSSVAYKRSGDIWSEIKSGYYISAIYEDSKQNIWIAQGIMCTAYSMIYIYKTDGSKDAIYMYSLVRGLKQDKNNNIWIATIGQGLVKYKYYK